MSDTFGQVGASKMEQQGLWIVTSFISLPQSLLKHVTIQAQKHVPLIPAEVEQVKSLDFYGTHGYVVKLVSK